MVDAWQVSVVKSRYRFKLMIAYEMLETTYYEFCTMKISRITVLSNKRLKERAWDGKNFPLSPFSSHLPFGSTGHWKFISLRINLTNEFLLCHGTVNRHARTHMEGKSSWGAKFTWRSWMADIHIWEEILYVIEHVILSDLFLLFRRRACNWYRYTDTKCSAWILLTGLYVSTLQPDRVTSGGHEDNGIHILSHGDHTAPWCKEAELWLWCSVAENWTSIRSAKHNVVVYLTAYSLAIGDSFLWL